jgi:hypothetical protein
MAKKTAGPGRFPDPLLRSGERRFTDRDGIRLLDHRQTIEFPVGINDLVDVRIGQLLQLAVGVVTAPAGIAVDDDAFVFLQHTRLQCKTSHRDIDRTRYVPGRA